ncbi:predicted protein [Coccidioides posadasii str. Silveira]|uniref:Predicted protein n=2 Tax=Coccidioides posadasii TaxID=199306 RepID=E9D414_COCPS|nr:predicted protein [Coccidioides posadasii str. Silveira]KMM72446.1 hypothetical protein CPAG_08740 [Coccidioides posadasii RMSCC 3488]
MSYHWAGSKTTFYLLLHPSARHSRIAPDRNHGEKAQVPFSQPGWSTLDSNLDQKLSNDESLINHDLQMWLPPTLDGAIHSDSYSHLSGRLIASMESGRSTITSHWRISYREFYRHHQVNSRFSMLITTGGGRCGKYSIRSTEYIAQ